MEYKLEVCNASPANGNDKIATPENKSSVQCSTMKVVNIERVSEWMNENFV